jgi:uncharacterized protein
VADGSAVLGQAVEPEGAAESEGDSGSSGDPAVGAGATETASFAPDGSGASGTSGTSPVRVAQHAQLEPDAVFRLSRVVSVEVELPDQYPLVVLEEVEEERRRLSFRIGASEGVALAHALRGTRAPRPLTQELFGRVLERFRIDVLAVRLTARRGTTYFAELELAGPAGHVVVGCRPSDGLCLALGRRVPAPVLADERLFSTQGDVEEAPDEGEQGEHGEPNEHAEHGEPNEHAEHGGHVTPADVEGGTGR